MLHYSRHYSALTNGTNTAVRQAGGDLQNRDLTSESELPRCDVSLALFEASSESCSLSGCTSITRTLCGARAVESGWQLTSKRVLCTVLP
jgi:hypothetical protein